MGMTTTNCIWMKKLHPALASVMSFTPWVHFSIWSNPFLHWDHRQGKIKSTAAVLEMNGEWARVLQPLAQLRLLHSSFLWKQIHQRLMKMSKPQWIILRRLMIPCCQPWQPPALFRRQLKKHFCFQHCLRDLANRWWRHHHHHRWHHIAWCQLPKIHGRHWVR